MVITSLPYVNGSTGSAAEFIRGIVAAIEDGKLLGVDDVVNESAKGETRIAIQLVRGCTPTRSSPGCCGRPTCRSPTRYGCTPSTFEGSPKLYNLRTAVEAWIGHRVEVIERRSLRRIEIISERLHLLDGLSTVLLDIDAGDRDDRHVGRRRRGFSRRADRPFGIDEVQANYVLDLTLRRLTRSRPGRTRQREQRQLRSELARLQTLVASPTKLRRAVGTELAEVAEMFAGSERRTEMTTAALPSATIAIPDEPMELAVTDTGYVQAFKASARSRPERRDRRRRIATRPPARSRPGRDRSAVPGDRRLVPDRQADGDRRPALAGVTKDRGPAVGLGGGTAG